MTETSPIRRLSVAGVAKSPGMARVLVIEDEADLREVLAYNLAQAGHRPFAAATGDSGFKLAQEVRPDIVLLDLMLPDIPGTVVAKSLRREPLTQFVPIIMVTAKAEEIDRIVGFELGADDYVVKPFSVRELMLRIDAVLRRGRTSEQRTIAVSELYIDKEAHRVTVGGEEISLTALEFKLLVTLTSAATACRREARCSATSGRSTPRSRPGRSTRTSSACATSSVRPGASSRPSAASAIASASCRRRRRRSRRSRGRSDHE